MKKILLLIYFLSFHVISELTLEITQGTEDPYRVAIIKFSGADKAATDIQKVVFDNLLRTGEFTIFDDEDLFCLAHQDERQLSLLIDLLHINL